MTVQGSQYDRPVNLPGAMGAATPTGSLGADPNMLSRAQQNQWQREENQKQIDLSREGQQLNYNAQVLPQQLKQQRFDTVFPWLQNTFGQLGGQLGGLFGNNGFATPGGTGPARPTFNTGGIWSGGQVQQQLQGQLASNNASLANQQRGIQQNLASRGQGGNTALSSALSQMAQGTNLMNNTALRRDLPFGYAQQNRQVSDQNVVGAENQAHNVATEDTARRQPYFNLFSSYLGALPSFGNLIG